MWTYITQHRFIWLFLVLMTGVVADQATKAWAQKNLAELYEVQEEVIIDNKLSTVKRHYFYPVKAIEVVPGFFNLIYKENPAAAFSLTSSIPDWIRRPALISISIIATLFFLFCYVRLREKDGFLLASFSFIIAGALGNLIDRLRFGYVIDFLDIYAGIFAYPHAHWPTFNIADSLIVVGACGVIIRTMWPLPPAKLKQNSVDLSS